MRDKSESEKSHGEEQVQGARFKPGTGNLLNTTIALDQSKFISGPRRVEQTLENLGMNLLSGSPDFEEMEEVGSGGVGIVSVARDENLGRALAVKMLRPEYRFSTEHIERMVREARATAQLEHPNIVPVHQLGVDSRYGVFFTMKKLTGETLRDVLQKLQEGQEEYIREYPRAKLLAIFLKTCNGVAFAHSKGVINRDLKPENIQIGQFGEVTVMDWGLVRKMKPLKKPLLNSDIYEDRISGLRAENQHQEEAVHFSRHDTSNLTIEDLVNGTPRYMSPEQACGENENLDHRCDIYSLGVILYEILTWRNPFEELQEVSDILQAVSHGRFLRPRQTRPYGTTISREMEAICLKAMALNREDRYSSVGDLIRDLYDHQAERPIAAYSPPWYMRCYKMMKRNSLKTTFFFTVFLTIFLSASFVLTLDGWLYRKNMALIERDNASIAFCQARLKAMEKQVDDVSPEWHFADLPYDVNNNLHRQIFEKENEVLILLNQVYLRLNSLSMLTKRRRDVKELWEENLTARLQFSLERRHVKDFKQWLGMVKTNFGENFEKCSSKTRKALLEAEKRYRAIIEGKTE